MPTINNTENNVESASAPKKSFWTKVGNFFKEIPYFIMKPFIAIKDLFSKDKDKDKNPDRTEESEGNVQAPEPYEITDVNTEQDLQKRAIIDKLKTLNITYDYTINDDYTVDIDTDLNLSGLDLSAGIPVNFRNVEGNFIANDCKLTSFNGPKVVRGAVECHNNYFKSLENGPEEVGYDYDISRNYDPDQHKGLNNLKGVPRKIGRDFYCSGNNITNIEGIKDITVEGNFYYLWRPYHHDNPGLWSSEDIRNLCTVNGFIQAYDPQEKIDFNKKNITLLVNQIKELLEVADIEINDDGTIDIIGDADINKLIAARVNILNLPMINMVDGDFIMDNYGDTDLKIAPKIVIGNFSANNMSNLNSLNGIPTEVVEDFSLLYGKVTFDPDQISKLCKVGGQIFTSLSSPDEVSANTLKEVEKLMAKLRLTNLKYSIIDSGIVNIYENLIIHSQIFENNKFPFKLGKIEGNFEVINCRLETFENFPYYVKGNLRCSANLLQSFKYSPRIIKGSFDASNNKITNFKFTPDFIADDFDCSYNMINSLDGLDGTEIGVSMIYNSSLSGAPTNKFFPDEAIRIKCFKSDNIRIII